MEFRISPHPMAANHPAFAGVTRIDTYTEDSVMSLATVYVSERDGSHPDPDEYNGGDEWYTERNLPQWARDILDQKLGPILMAANFKI